MQILWNGHYADGRTAVSYPVTVILTSTEVRITKADGTFFLWPYGEITQTQGFYEGEHVRLERGVDTGEALIIEDADFLHSLRTMSPSFAGRFHDPSSRRGRLQWILIGTLAVLAGVVAAYLWGIPAISHALAEAVPPAWEAKLGQAVVEQIVSDASECTEPLPTKSLEKIVEALNSAMVNHPYIFTVHLVEDETMNALAAPGGHIVVFTGLLKETKSAEELAGVLAHEMQHVLNRHVTKRIFQNASTSILLAMIVGDTNGIAGFAMEGLKTLGDLRYSRAFEEEADLLGMELMIKARIDPSGMVSFFENLQNMHGNVPHALRYLSTHPLTIDRIQKLNAAAAGAPGTHQPLLPEVSWADVIHACGKGEKKPTQERKGP